MSKVTITLMDGYRLEARRYDVKYRQCFFIPTLETLLKIFVYSRSFAESIVFL